MWVVLLSFDESKCSLFRNMHHFVNEIVVSCISLTVGVHVGVFGLLLSVGHGGSSGNFLWF